MIKIEQNISLKPYTTFGIDVKAKYFVVLKHSYELDNILALPFTDLTKRLIIGCGSNILFSQDYDGLIIKNEIQGIQLKDENEDFVRIKVNAGENWHNLVLYCVEKGWGGIENLSLIPGNVGAAPIQNIGAYGVEFKEVLEEVEFFRFDTSSICHYTNADCKFSYRNSIFKNELKDKTLILSLTLKLSKKPVFNTSYSALSNELKKLNLPILNLRIISDTVCSIRRSKLPDPHKIGNAGSFFKNPEISAEKFLQLKEKYPNLTAYDSETGLKKLPAGWLIEQCGLKGYRQGDAGIHKNQALVIVNYGNASGKEILNLAEMVCEKVLHKFGVSLEKEVNVY